jgi:ABC-type lipoprotein export system ATPase subunit
MRVTLTGVEARYGTAPPVLHDLSIELAAGSTVAITGPSGSGKSTLLAVIGGLLTPSQGTVDWSGVKDTHAARMHASWVPQSVAVLGRRTVLANVAVGGYASGLSRSQAEQAALPLIAKVGLGPLAFRRANTLSGGEVQRVTIARAMQGRPDLVLADEPTGQLDAATTATVTEALFAAKPADSLLVVATHDPAVAARCGTVLRIVNGKVEA